MFNLILGIFAIAFGSAFQHGFNTGVMNEIEEVVVAWIRNCDPKDLDNCDESVEDHELYWSAIV